MRSALSFMTSLRGLVLFTLLLPGAARRSARVSGSAEISETKWQFPLTRSPFHRTAPVVNGRGRPAILSMTTAQRSKEHYERAERKAYKLEPRPMRTGLNESRSPADVGTFDMKTYIADTAAVVNEALDAAVPRTYPETLSSAMRYSLMAGGKRVRPMIVLAACSLVGGDTAHAMPTAVAIEMIHTFSLIHDDLPSMDNDDYRRGKPTCHKVYGENMAILAGDALLSDALTHIARETREVPAERVLRVVTEVGGVTHGLAGGQVVDIESEGEAVGSETLRYIHEHKTAGLLEAAAVSGAILGGATDAQVEKLRSYAKKIGLAFQVVDDILDVTATSEELGKTAGKDVSTGKTTYPSIYGLEKSRAIAKELIADAKAELAEFDPARAAPLLGLADYVGARKH